MSKNLAELLVETLVHAGVQRIYGVAGDSLNGITDAIRRGGLLSWIHVRHEEGAACAAEAEAHLTGKLAACAGSCGPGNTHLINIRQSSGTLDSTVHYSRTGSGLQPL